MVLPVRALNGEILAGLHFEEPGTAGQLRQCIADCCHESALEPLDRGGVTLFKTSKAQEPRGEEQNMILVEDWYEELDGDHYDYTYVLVQRRFDVWKDMLQASEEYLNRSLHITRFWSCQSAETLRDRFGVESFDEFADQALRQLAVSTSPSDMLHHHHDENDLRGNYDCFLHKWRETARSHVQECVRRCRPHIQMPSGDIVSSRVLVTWSGRDDVQEGILCEHNGWYYIVRHARLDFGLPWVAY
eukprot:TRINITY_DN15929_c0_g1_i7.p2 TRINITY_DN15929_c0_g1~~TRINITY_DN15929_c0_g1_i7.p2  ORF type:complete len:245 (-),score=30.78 TRINITY_DN15929_c0_g1_i7:167-901(-)